MAVIVFDDLVEKRRELLVRIVRACIDTDSRARLLNSREDGLLESVTVDILGVRKFGPDFSGHVAAHRRLLLTLRPDGVSSGFAEVLEMRTAGCVCHFTTTSKGFLGVDESFHAVIHVLDELSFGATKASSV